MSNRRSGETHYCRNSSNIKRIILVRKLSIFVLSSHGEVIILELLLCTDQVSPLRHLTDIFRCAIRLGVRIHHNRLSRISHDRLVSAAAGAAVTLAVLWLGLITAAAAAVLLRA